MRKHVLLNSLQADVEPPGEGQHIVMAVGSRGSNLIEVEYPDGRRTLCLLPARFHKKLWIKRGNYLIVESEEGTDAAVSGQIVHVLFADHVKQMKKIPGAWPQQFQVGASSSGKEEEAAAEVLGAVESDREVEEAAAQLGKLDVSASGTVEEAEAVDLEAGGGGTAAAAGERGTASEGDSSSDDDLPPITRIQNRRVVEYEMSDSDSD